MAREAAAYWRVGPVILSDGLRGGIARRATPMGKAAVMATYMLIRHRVKDWNKWKVAYDDHGGARQKAGVMARPEILFLNTA